MPSNQTWNQWLLGHRPLSALFPIDRLVTVESGMGSQVIDARRLPHGRYTIFINFDPADGGETFEVSRDPGNATEHDLRRWGSPAVPLVQTELPKGTYRFAVRVRSAGVCWQMQLVLNAMMSWATPPKPWRPRLAPPSLINLTNATEQRFQISQTGHYKMLLRVDGFQADQKTFPTEFCPFNLGLRAADGHRVHLADGGGNTARWPDMAFLGAGDWTIEMMTKCEWQLVIRPMLGWAGGGARWF